MYVAITAVIASLFVGCVVGSLTSSEELFVLTSAAVAFGILIYRIESLRKAILSAKESAPVKTPEKEEVTMTEPVPEEESYGVNELPDEE